LGANYAPARSQQRQIINRLSVSGDANRSQRRPHQRAHRHHLALHRDLACGQRRLQAHSIFAGKKTEFLILIKQ